MDPKPKLTVPAALVVVALGAGCTSSPTPSTDAGVPDDAPVLADASAFDAGCVDPEVWDPVAMACVPIV